jgi:uncharacterized protein YndB with AHSA1/START domain
VSRTDSASLVVAADRGRVFAALVDEAALVAWLPPDGMTGHFERFDPRPGGSYRLVLAYDDPSAGGKTGDGTDVVVARFVEVVPNERVVQAVEFAGEDPAYAGTMRMTWQVEAVPDGTLVTFRADDVPAGISAADHAAGLASSLTHLAAYVED